MIYEIEQRLRRLEGFMRDSFYDTRHAVRSELYQHHRLDIQKTGCPHLFSALCVNTIDPMAEGQVQFYTPYLTLPGTPVGGLPWAYPISVFGGFDDSGVSWVPPAGSKLALFCENGDVNQAYYIGTFWTSTRGVASSSGQNQDDTQGDSSLPPEEDSRNDLWGYQVPEYECFVGDTDVITLDGVKHIKDVDVGDYVLTHSNRYRKVIGKSKRKYKGPAIKIKTYGNNKDIICTPEHPFYVTDKTGRKYEWKKACELERLGSQVVNFNRLIKPGFSVVKKELVELIGWYITEGSVGKTSVIISLNKLETNIRDRIIELARICLDCNCSTRETDTALNVSINSAQFRELCISQCGRGANNKKIPFSLICGHEELLYETLISGDGHRRDQDDSFGTISKTLAYQLVLLANQIGKVASLQEVKRDGVGIILGRKVNLKNAYMVRIYQPTNNINTKLKRNGRTVSAKIRSTDGIEINEDVYNLEVEVDHSYTANGRIVHNCLWEGTRDGYLLGSNRGDQVKMPWNTDNYQTKDWDTKDDFDPNPESNQFITYPHIYGFKTPGKHYWKGQDGDHRCNDRWSHLEMASGRGNIFMMKDDHLHPASQWAFSGDLNQSDQNGGTLDTEDNNQCYQPLQDYTDCTTPNEKTDCQDPNNPEQDNNSSQGQSDANSTSNDSISEEEFANAFFKRKEEMRFYKAVDSLAQYQNPKCELEQSGIQIQSVGGLQIVMDDSVDQPQGKPDWKLDYDFGCNNVTKAKMFLRSQTGHGIFMDDEEEDSLIRSENNGIRMFTATGNRIEMLDHTLGEKENPQQAGEKRGIFMKSTSQHVLEFHDNGNKQFSMPRQHPPIDEETGEIPDITEAKADQAFVLLRSGYGLQLRMDDSFSQENTQQQYIQLLAPQKDNTERGPHQMVFQEQPEGPGLVMLRAGGVYYRSSYDDAIEVVGDENNPNPSNKFVQVTGNYIVDADEYYFNHNDLTIFQAEKYIILFAGRDCPNDGNPENTAASANQAAMENIQIAAESNAQGQPNQLPLNKGPCLFPVVVAKSPFVCPFTNFIHYGVMSDPADPTHTKLLYNSLSDRVFASASQDQEESGSGE